MHTYQTFVLQFFTSISTPLGYAIEIYIYFYTCTYRACVGVDVGFYKQKSNPFNICKTTRNTSSSALAQNRGRTNIS